MASGSGPDLLLDPDSTLDFDFSLIGGNAGTSLTEAQTADANGNLIGSAAGAGIIDPLLAPLADNGGPTQTHALLAGSPAIDAGDPTAVAGVGDTPLFDQRGTGFDRVLGGRLDIGAFESINDTAVDGADLTVWQSQFGQPVSPVVAVVGSGQSTVGGGR